LIEVQIFLLCKHHFMNITNVKQEVNKTVGEGFATLILEGYPRNTTCASDY